ncbi:hypothetical protein AAFF_G00166780 [Aldrovandia affinis]|uniref:Uncharacterized protein n=1 Tax=Aldrovandia affinis TaxID=143900 RepID=A0AAD7W8F8_9TELE|nr:hypothetical protein AAFF_G00166780 [Aldrovandia affinis]
MLKGLTTGEASRTSRETRGRFASSHYKLTTASGDSTQAEPDGSPWQCGRWPYGEVRGHSGGLQQEEK